MEVDMLVPIAYGMALPEMVLDNTQIADKIAREGGKATSDAEIYRRSKIRKRHIADIQKGETPTFLAVEAAKNALENIGYTIRDIDLLIVASTYPDTFVPHIACAVQEQLTGDQEDVAFPAFDINVACSGFVYAMTLADALVRCHAKYQRVLLIGTDVLSAAIDWSDVATACIFGDGAGAMILEQISRTSVYYPMGILGATLTAQGNSNILSLARGGKIRMTGSRVFGTAVEICIQQIRQVLEENRLTLHEIDLLIPHQANGRILKKVADVLPFPLNKIHQTIEEHGNTGAASVPIAFADAFQKGLFDRPQTIVTAAFGGGMSGAAVALKI